MVKRNYDQMKQLAFLYIFRLYFYRVNFKFLKHTGLKIVKKHFLFLKKTIIFSDSGSVYFLENFDDKIIDF